MQSYYTVDLYQAGHWYEWHTFQTRDVAEKFFNVYIKNDTIDDVAIKHHTAQRTLIIKSKLQAHECILHN